MAEAGAVRSPDDVTELGVHERDDGDRTDERRHGGRRVVARLDFGDVDLNAVTPTTAFAAGAEASQLQHAYLQHSKSL